MPVATPSHSLIISSAVLNIVVIPSSEFSFHMFFTTKSPIGFSFISFFHHLAMPHVFSNYLSISGTFIVSVLMSLSGNFSISVTFVSISFYWFFSHLDFFFFPPPQTWKKHKLLENTEYTAEGVLLSFISNLLSHLFSSQDV